MKPVFTLPFIRDYRRLPPRIQRRFDTALGLLLSDPRHPSLRAKKMEGQRDSEGRDIWEARVTQGYRFTFVIEGATYLLRRIGPHEDALRHP
jgi:mRNA-degrading endonuclease RelE of RelBE toxin-antitoxin system